MCKLRLKSSSSCPKKHIEYAKTPAHATLKLENPDFVPPKYLKTAAAPEVAAGPSSKVTVSNAQAENDRKRGRDQEMADGDGQGKRQKDGADEDMDVDDDGPSGMSRSLALVALGLTRFGPYSSTSDQSRQYPKLYFAPRESSSRSHRRCTGSPVPTVRRIQRIPVSQSLHPLLLLSQIPRIPVDTCISRARRQQEQDRPCKIRSSRPGHNCQRCTGRFQAKEGLGHESVLRMIMS